MNFNLKTTSVLIIVLVVLISFFYFVFSNQKAEINLYQVEKGEIREKVLEIGTIIQEQEIYLTFENSGKIKEINIKTGDEVKQGQVLARVDDTQVTNQLQEARYNL